MSHRMYNDSTLKNVNTKKLIAQDIKVKNFNLGNTGNLVINNSLSINGSLQVDYISSRLGNGLKLNDSILVDNISPLTGTKITIDGSLNVNKTLIGNKVELKKIFSPSGTLLVDSSVSITGSLQVDTISPKTGTKITLDGSLVVSGKITGNIGPSLDIQIIKSTSSGTLVVDASVIIQGSLVVDKISGRNSNGITINSSLIVDYISPNNNTFVTANDSLVVKGDLLADRLYIDTLSPTGNILTVSGTLNIGNSLQTDYISPKNNTNVEINSELKVDKISANNSSVVTINGSLQVDGIKSSGSSVIIQGMPIQEGFYTNNYACGLFNSVAQTDVPNTTLTTVAFDTTEFDTNGNMADLANNRIYCRKSGIYLICANVQFDTSGNTTGYRSIYVGKNGSYISVRRLGGIDSPHSSLTFSESLTNGDYIYLECYQTSGGNVILGNEGDSTYGSRLQMILVSYGST